MPIDLRVEEDRIKSLSNEAKETLKTHVNQYIDDVIKESSLIEEALRENGANREITSNHILQAVRRNKKDFSIRKANKSLIWKIVSPLSIMITGLLFDTNGYKDNIPKLIFFILALIIASISTVLQHIKERE